MIPVNYAWILWLFFTGTVANLTTNLDPKGQEKYDSFLDKAERRIQLDRDTEYGNNTCPPCELSEQTIAAKNTCDKINQELELEIQSLNAMLNVFAEELNTTSYALKNANELINASLTENSLQKLNKACTLLQYPDENCIDPKYWTLAELSIYPKMNGNTAWAYYTQLFPSYRKSLRGNPRTILKMQSHFPQFTLAVLHQNLTSFQNDLHTEYMVSK